MFDCRNGSKGSWELPPAATTSLAAAAEACAARCALCARCRAVSVSPKWADCSWFWQCDPSRLRRNPSGFRTAQLRHGGFVSGYARARGRGR